MTNTSPMTNVKDCPGVWVDVYMLHFQAIHCWANSFMWPKPVHSGLLAGPSALTRNNICNMGISTSMANIPKKA